MNSRYVIVPVTPEVNDQVAMSIAMAELAGVYSSAGAEIKLKKLNSEGIDEQSLAQYFKDVIYIQAAFCQQKRTGDRAILNRYGFSFSQVRVLYLTPIIATIASQMGDVDIGPYHIEVHAAEQAKVDHTRVIKMSEALYRNRNILYSQRDQIGVATAQATVDMMSTIVVNMCEGERVAKVGVFNSVNPDPRCVAIGMMMGLNLINAAQDVLYPFEEYVSYDEPYRVVATSSPAPKS